MPKLTPTMRVALTILAAVIAGLASVQDSLPEAVQAVLTVAATVLAAIGIIPPQVPTHSVLDPKTSVKDR